MAHGLKLHVMTLVKIGGEISKPATVLVEKISGAVSGIFQPFQIVRVAKAQAMANEIFAASDLRISDMQKRAIPRLLEEEEKKQANMECIIQKALPLLEGTSTPNDIEDDWITYFFDKCRNVSDNDMQRLWSHVLAGEANVPGSFCRRTINSLSEMDKYDAEIFVSICKFCWMINKMLYPIVFDSEAQIYNNIQINFSSLSHLDSIGLIRFSLGGLFPGFGLTKIPKTLSVSYCDKSLELTFPKDDESNYLPLGYVIFTKSGRELTSICNVDRGSEIDGFFEYVFDQWAEHSLAPRKSIEQSTPQPD